MATTGLNAGLAPAADQVLPPLFPTMGAIGPHRAADLRVICHGEYAIYYPPRDDEMVMVCVVSGVMEERINLIICGRFPADF